MHRAFQQVKTLRHCASTSLALVWTGEQTHCGTWGQSLPPPTCFPVCNIREGSKATVSEAPLGQGLEPGRLLLISCTQRLDPSSRPGVVLPLNSLALGKQLEGPISQPGLLTTPLSGCQ